ncbi:MAG: 1-acyl-sn-glycerol-3-phosphate acyltransferase [Streptosporangiaceae bacterium]|jgi:1-acyl-sn-glycerol-3-phosphate acyltransferase
MKPPPAGIRRVIVRPLWLPVAVVLSLIFVLIAAVTVIATPLSRHRRPMRLALFAVVYVFADVCLLVAATGLWLRHPLRGRRVEERWTAVHIGLLGWALSLIVAAGRPLLGFHVELEEPPDAAVINDRPLLVLARHGGLGDSFTLVHLLLSRYHRRPVVVLKDTLQWDPGLDTVLTRLSACFLPARLKAGHDAAGQLAERARDLHGSDAMLIFPEGGNWTPRRLRQAIARLRRDGDHRAASDAATNAHVLPPRPGGVLACLAARPDLDVIVVAHTGLDDLVTVRQVWDALPLTGRPMTIRWWYEEAPAERVDSGERYQWLRAQWAIVDAWIDARKARESAGEPAGSPPVLTQSAGETE